MVIETGKKKKTVFVATQRCMSCLFRLFTHLFGPFKMVVTKNWATLFQMNAIFVITIRISIVITIKGFI